MFLPSKKNTFNWHDLWTDLLQGAGAGLLHYDGGRMAQAALAGLAAFDAAGRERENRQSEGHPEENGGEQPEAWPWDTRLAELAHLPPQALAALLAQQHGAFGTSYGADGLGFYSQSPNSPITGRRPHSLYPFGGSPLENALPFGSDGRLNAGIFGR